MSNAWSGAPGEDELDLQPTSSSSSSSQNNAATEPSGENAIKSGGQKGKEAEGQQIAWRGGGGGGDDDGGMAAERGENEESGMKEPKMAESWAEMIRAWPKTTICIVSNEFCERFSYYGMRTVLTLYLLNVLGFSNDTATVLFNGFTVLCYFTPLLGSILADGYIGKFKTIFFVSILYTVGQVTLALVSTQGTGSWLHPWVDILGLVIIGFGTGGIKPCVCSFGGDQFDGHQLKMLSIFFSAFYFSINAGSMISTFISPMFRATPCMGQDSCYPMAFGIPAALMVVATLLFISGSFWYKKMPPKENIFGEVYKASKKAIGNRWHSHQRAHAHWLDYYFDTHFCAYDQRCLELQRKRGDDSGACHKRQFIADIKGLLRLLVMYLPAPMFWALYDQQGSRWLIQAVAMDSRLWGDSLLLPDQMQTLNAVLILLFIPIFQAAIYPLVSLCFRVTPLRKMIAGCLLAALAFVVAAGVQFKVNETLPDTPMAGQSFLSAINALPGGCNVTICAENGKGPCRHLVPGQILTNSDRERREMFELAAGKQRWTIAFEGNEKECPRTVPMPPGQWTAEWELEEQKTHWMMVSGAGVLFGRANTKKPTEGSGEFSLGIALALDDLDNYMGNLALCRKEEGGSISGNATTNPPQQFPCDPHKAEDFYMWPVNGTEEYQQGTGKATIYPFKSVRPGDWALYLLDGPVAKRREELKVRGTGVELSIKAQGGVYMLALTGNLGAKQVKSHRFQVVPDNSVSILWQVPQIAILTAAEILFSITGYEFAYSQAAPSMKSLVQALWLLTTATGDAIIVLVALFRIRNMAVEFLLYACAMVAATVALALLAIFYYEYNNYAGDEEEEDELTGLKKKKMMGDDDGKKGGGGGGIGTGSGRKSAQMYGSNEEEVEGGLDGEKGRGEAKVNQAFDKEEEEGKSIRF